MATKVGEAYVEVRGDGTNLKGDIARASNPGLFRSAGGSIGKGLLLGIGGAFVAKGAFDFVTGAISEASDLNESINAVNVTFEDSARGIKRLGREAATAVGLSNNEFNGLAVQFSNFATTVAGRGGNVTRTMDDLTTRAADFASVMNKDVAEAATLFQSGLAGETEPLRRYGIDLSAAAVEQHAFEEGIAETGATLTEQQKVQARYSLLMEQTAKTAGDFANTSDGLANSQRILGAEFDNVQGKIGKALLPAAKEFVGFLREEAVPKLEEFGDWFAEDGIDAIKDFGEGVGDVYDEVKPLIDIAVDLGQAVAGLPAPVKLFGVEALIAAAAVSKLRTATAGSWLTGFGTSLRNAETRSAALGSAAKTAAGVGGILALVDASDQSSQALGALEGAAGGALLGFSLGGPWGAAVGAGAGALFGLATNTEGVTAAMEVAQPVIGDYAFELDGATAATRRLNQETAITALQDSGALDAAKKVGVDIGLLADAVTGNAKAYAKVNAQIRAAYKEQGIKGAGDLRASPDADEDVLESLLQLSNALGENHAAFVKGRNDAKERADALDGVKKPMVEFGEATKETTRRLNELDDTRPKVKVDSGEATRKLIDVRNSVLDLDGLNATIQVSLAAAGVYAALDSIKANLFGGGFTSDLPSTKPRGDFGGGGSGEIPSSQDKGLAPRRIQLDLGEGKKLSGWMQDEISDDHAFRGTLGRMRR